MGRVFRITTAVDSSSKDSVGYVGQAKGVRIVGNVGRVVILCVLLVLIAYLLTVGLPIKLRY